MRIKNNHFSLLPPRVPDTFGEAADREKKLQRDQSYTYLKQAMDAIRECGQFVFWKDEDRSKGYASEYLRQNRQRAEAKAATDSSEQ